MKQLIITLVMGVLCSVMYAQKINITFDNTSLSEALKQIDQADKSVNIQFIYDDLEDYRVSKVVKCNNAIDAIREVCGLYPMKIKQTDKNIFVESLVESKTKVIGRVIDEDKNPLEYASVALFSVVDSSYISGGVTNVNGDFVIPCESDSVLVRVSFVGYNTFDKAYATGNIGTISMKANDIMLKTVRVKGERPMAKMEGGKLLFDMTVLQEQIPSNNAFELLSHVPSLFERDGQFIIGNQVATVIINGKTTTLSQSQVMDILRTMPADKMKTVEVMLAAPAKYHVRGAAINIITRGFKGKNGVSGQIQHGVEYDHYYSEKLSGSMQINNGNLAVDFMLSLNNDKTYFKSEEQAVHPSRETEYIEIGNRTEIDNHDKKIDYRIEAEYAFDTDHKIYISYSGSREKTDDTSLTKGRHRYLHIPPVGEYWYGDNHDRDIRYDYQYRTNTRNKIDNFDFGYSNPIGLTLGASYLRFRSPQEQNISDDSEINAGTGAEEVDKFFHSGNLAGEAISGQNIDKLLFTADQSIELSESSSLDFGAEYQYTKHASNSVQKFATKSDDISHEKEESELDQTEKIASAYISWNKKFNGILSASVSLEGEKYKTLGTDEFYLYPSLNVTCIINSDNIFNVSFSSNSSYPDYWYLLGNSYYLNQYSVIVGNKDLSPARDYNTSIMWRFKKRYMLNIFDNISIDHNSQLPYQSESEQKLILQKVNIDRYEVRGAMASGSFNIANVVNGNLSAAIMKAYWKTDDFHGIAFDREKISARFSGTISANIIPRQNVKAIVSSYYQTKAIQGVYDLDHMFNVNASFKWISPKEILSASIGVNNITNASVVMDDKIENQNYSMEMWNNWRTYQASFTVRIGSYKEKKHKEADTSRMGHQN